MDDFLEQVAGRRHSALSSIAYILGWFLIIVFALLAAMSFSGIMGTNEEGFFYFNWLDLIIAIVCAAIAFVLWRCIDYVITEYDYSFTNGNLDVSRVLNRKRRKYLTALDMKDVIRCGPVASQGFKKTLNEPGIKKHSWYVNGAAPLTYFYFKRKEVKHVIILELNKEMIDMVRSKNYLTRGAWTDDESTQRLYGSVSR